MNEEPAVDSSLDLTLTKHLRDEDFGSQEKVVTKLKTLLFLHGFQFPVLDTIIGCAI